jgi:hypothetical protein
MFLRHLLRVDAHDLVQQAIILYVDFVREPLSAEVLTDYIVDRMVEQLESAHGIRIDEGQFVRAVYNREINAFKKTLIGELAESDPVEYKRHEREMLMVHLQKRTEHVRRSLEHVRASSGRTPLVVLDNIDQRPPGFQDRIFETAHSIADSWPGTVFVSLRPSTFFESQAHGPVAAYQPRVFTIAPARTDQVIIKRLQYARQKAQETGLQGVFPVNLSIQSQDLTSYLDALIKAFTLDEDLKAMVDNMSGGNLRQALFFLYSFIGSGYVSTARVLDVAESGRVYTVPLHELLRAIIFGDADYFDPKTSPVCNIWDISSNDGREHFLLPNILGHIQRVGESAGRSGFVEMSEVYKFGQSLGCSQEQVGGQLQRAISKRLVDFVEGRNGGSYRITSVGSYMYRRMSCMFSYVDAMVVDTPITDVAFRAKIDDAKTILDRLRRTRVFCEYLDQQWNIFTESREGQQLPFNWEEMALRLRGEMDKAEEKARQAADRWRDSGGYRN